MPKLNYVNASLACEASDIHSASLTARSSEASSQKTWLKAGPSHKDNSAIDLHADDRILTDKGIEAIAGALEDILPANNPLQSQLCILTLKGNLLTATSLGLLSLTIRFAANDLQELDLSSNNICLDSREALKNWDAFLSALSRCTRLRRLDLSHNDFTGAAPWELFARHFEIQYRDNARANPMLMERVNGVVSIEFVDEQETEFGATAQRQDDTLRGLLSVSTINFEDTGLSDNGALWLSYCTGKHSWIQSKNEDFRMAAEGLQSIQVSQQNLSHIGQSLLSAVENVSYDPLSANMRVSPTHRKSSQIKFVFAENGLTCRHKRTNSSGSEPSPFERPFAGLAIETPIETAERLRRKLQRTMLEDRGVSASNLWLAALKMLVIARQILPPSQGCTWPQLTPPLRLRTVSANISPHYSPHTPSPSPTYASKLVLDTAEIMGPVVAIVDSSPLDGARLHVPRSRHENVSYHPASPASTSPLSKKNGAARANVRQVAKEITAEVDLVGTLPLVIWHRILQNLCDPDATLSTAQVRRTVAWARDRHTLAGEAEMMGKPKSVQIWHALDGMGCLAYDED